VNLGAKDIKEPTVGISEQNFSSVLKLLDVWATKEQAACLFDKYDANGDGRLTAYEFISRCRPVDYDVSVDSWNKEPLQRETGKRIFTQSGNVPMIPNAPSPRMTVPKMADDLRTKFKQTHPNRHSMNSSRAKLNTYFAYYDRQRAGQVTPSDLRRVLDNVNLNVGEENAETLFKKFSHNGHFDYRQFSDYVFPQHEDTQLSTSLEIGEAFYERNSRDRKSFERANRCHSNTFRRLRPPLQPQTARNAQLMAYSNMRPGASTPQPHSARLFGRPPSRSSLPPMEVGSRPSSALMNAVQNARPKIPSRPGTASASTGALRPPRPQTSRPGTAHRYASVGNLGLNERPTSRGDFLGSNDVSPIPDMKAATQQAPLAWERSKTAQERPKTGQASPQQFYVPVRPASRASAVMSNPLDIKSQLLGAQPPRGPTPQSVNTSGIPAVRADSRTAPSGPRLRKVRKLKKKTKTKSSGYGMYGRSKGYGKKKNYGKLGMYGRPRPPQKRSLGAADSRYSPNPYLQATFHLV
jgi:Ca2+-binding EF-hand superfamily protein